MSQAPSQQVRVRRKPVKFTTGAKITVAALSMTGFIGGWNLIARLDQREAQAHPMPQLRLVPAQPAAASWPVIQPLPTLPPIPTLAPAITTGQTASLTAANPNTNFFEPAPLPTLPPLPTLAALPTLPPPPPAPPPLLAGSGNQSGGS